MLFPALLAAALAAATTTAQTSPSFQLPPNTYNELLNGTCKANTLIYVRGPMEPGNTGNFGMGLIPVIQSMIPNLAVQGLNYPAGLMSTTRPYGAFPADMTSLTTTINSAVSKCPNTTILLSGWSLGTAVIRGSLKQLLSTPSGKEIVDKKIGGILLFGDTQYAQSNKTVEGLGGAEAGKFRIFCNGNDAVCGGQLTINQGHIDYMDSAAAGAQWLAGRAASAQAVKGGMSRRRFEG